MALSDTAIRNAKPAAKPVRMFDGGGLYLEVAPSGGKWWRLKFRHGGKEKRLSLGIYPRDPPTTTAHRNPTSAAPQPMHLQRLGQRREYQ